MALLAKFICEYYANGVFALFALISTVSPRKSCSHPSLEVERHDAVVIVHSFVYDENQTMSSGAALVLGSIARGIVESEVVRTRRLSHDREKGFPPTTRRFGDSALEDGGRSVSWREFQTYRQGNLPWLTVGYSRSFSGKFGGASGNPLSFVPTNVTYEYEGTKVRTKVTFKIKFMKVWRYLYTKVRRYEGNTFNVTHKLRTFFGVARFRICIEWLTSRFAAVWTQTLKPNPNPQRHGADPKDTARRLLLAVSGSMSAHLAQVKNRFWQRGTLQIYKGTLTRGWPIPPQGQNKIK